MAKNRLMFEPDESDPLDPIEPVVDFDETTHDPLYLDDTARTVRSFRALTWGGIGLVLLLVAGIVVYYFVKRSSSDLKDNDIAEVVVDGARDRYYIPQANLTDALKKGRSQYLQMSYDQARRTFQSILDDSTDDQERSLAHIFLGVMALEADRPGQARHHFLSAHKLDESSVGALVNLAIVERKLGNREEAQRYAEAAKKLAPDDAGVNMILANLLLESNDPESAEVIYRDGMLKTPEDATMRYNLALALIRQNKLDEAELEFSRLVELSPSDPLAVFSLSYLGQIAFSKNQPERAIEYYKRATALAPDQARNHYNLGVVYLQMGNQKAALQSFDQAVRAGGSDADVFQNLAIAYQKLNEPDLAVKALQRSLLLDSNNLRSLFQLAELYEKQKDLLHAAETYRRIVNITPGDTNTKEALVKLGQMYRSMERYQDSIDVLSRANTLAPKDAIIKYELGLTYRLGNRFDEAVTVWRQALRDGVSLDRDSERTIRFALGDSYRAKGAFDLALNEYRQIEIRNREAPVVNDDLGLQMRMGALYKDLKDEAKASHYFSLVYNSTEASPSQRKDAAKALASLLLSQNRHDSLHEADSWAYKAARLDQGDAETQLIRAEILLRNESGVDREKAIEILLSVVHSRLPSGLEARAYTLLGDGYYQNGEYRRATEAFETASEFDPSNSEILKKKRLAVSALREGR